MRFGSEAGARSSSWNLLNQETRAGIRKRHLRNYISPIKMALKTASERYVAVSVLLWICRRHFVSRLHLP